MCIAAALPASGCSMSFPMAGFVSDPVVTGSTNKNDALLYKALDPEDWRRAKAALAVALDPQGNGASVGWDNPQSGARGSFAAAAGPIPANDLICRPFKAHMHPGPGAERELSGSACRGPDGEWLVRDASETPPRG